MAVNFLVCWSAFSDEKVTCWHCFEFVPKVSLCHLNSLLFCRPHFFSSSKLFPPRGQIITSSYFLPLLFALLLFPVVLPPHRSTRHNFPTHVNTLSLSPLITGLLQSLFHNFYAHRTITFPLNSRTVYLSWTRETPRFRSPTVLYVSPAAVGRGLGQKFQPAQALL